MSPVFIDGAGPTASFYWGEDLPTPDLGEYYARQEYYDFIYFLPYALSALILTILGCGVAPVVLRTFKRLSSHAFVGAGVVTLALSLLLALASDAGSLYGLWNSPVFCLYERFGFYDAFVLSQLFLPISLLAGVAEVAKRRLFSASPYAHEPSAG